MKKEDIKVYKLNCCNSCEDEKESGYGGDIDGCCCIHKAELTNFQNKILEVGKWLHNQNSPVNAGRIADAMGANYYAVKKTLSNILERDVLSEFDKELFN